jgi:hypothetical protein
MHQQFVNAVNTLGLDSTSLGTCRSSGPEIGGAAPTAASLTNLFTSKVAPCADWLPGWLHRGGAEADPRFDGRGWLDARKRGEPFAGDCHVPRVAPSAHPPSFSIVLQFPAMPRPRQSCCAVLCLQKYRLYLKRAAGMTPSRSGRGRGRHSSGGGASHGEGPMSHHSGMEQLPEPGPEQSYSAMLGQSLGAGLGPGVPPVRSPQAPAVPQRPCS